MSEFAGVWLTSNSPRSRSSVPFLWSLRRLGFRSTFRDLGEHLLRHGLLLVSRDGHRNRECLAPWVHRMRLLDLFADLRQKSLSLPNGAEMKAGLLPHLYLQKSGLDKCFESGNVSGC